VNAYAWGESTPTLDVFYQSLSPYGRWVDHAVYGRVFIPGDHGYVPYRDGHWVYTDVGWYWQADEPFGWAVTHYGSWDYEPSYGYFWVPDTRWAPARVEWRHSGDLVGWAPQLPQRTYHRHASRPWSFVGRDDLTRPDLRQRVRRVDPVFVERRTSRIDAPPPGRYERVSRPRYQVRPSAPVDRVQIPSRERQPVRGFDRPPIEREPIPGRRVEPPRSTPRVEPRYPVPRIEPDPRPPRLEPRLPVPRREPPRAEPPRREPPRVEPPRAEPPRAEPPRAEPAPSRRLERPMPSRRVTPERQVDRPDKSDRDRGRPDRPSQGNRRRGHHDDD
jgi:hypothetical protein